MNNETIRTAFSTTAIGANGAGTYYVPRGTTARVVRESDTAGPHGQRYVVLAVRFPMFGNHEVEIEMNTINAFGLNAR